MFILTLVASPQTPRLTPAHIAQVHGLIDDIGLRMTGETTWLSPHHAVDINLFDAPRPDQMQKIMDLLAPNQIDVFATNKATRRSRMLFADMDSTMIAGETLDELAIRAGVGDQVADITKRAMAGELDFRAALDARMLLLKDLPQQAVQDTLDAQQFSAGAQTLISTLRADNCLCVLVSGGFTFFTGAIAERLGFHQHHGNVLDIKDGRLTGKIIDPVLGKQAKLDLLMDYATRLQVPLTLTAAIGDGANDLPMLQNAGLGIGYRPKPILRQNIMNHIVYGDLTAMLYAMGYTSADIAPHQNLS
jgi:phosphoserine phosphatase